MPATSTLRSSPPRHDEHRQPDEAEDDAAHRDSRDGLAGDPSQHQHEQRDDADDEGREPGGNTLLAQRDEAVPDPQQQRADEGRACELGPADPQTTESTRDEETATQGHAGHQEPDAGGEERGRLSTTIRIARYVEPQTT